MTDFIATRAHGQARCRAFAPAMGARYAGGRNYDHGPGRHTAVSTLSPWIRRRLLTEAEVIATAIAAHGPGRAGKFIEEVFWRSYFKGWLEHRPRVWDDYRGGLLDDLAALDRNHRLREDLARAEAGDTGLACFDAWVRELLDTGYLHNHARMWFASIWIFTLRLPWRIGADFFLRHLLDGDPASNTLSWRWVAGLHTRGKPYVARAANIATYTSHRHSPRHDELADVKGGLDDTEPDGLPSLQPLRAVTPPQPGRRTALLLTEEDCLVEDFPRDHLDLRTCATLTASARRSPRPVADAVFHFEAGALADAAARAGVQAVALRADQPTRLADWASAAGATQIVTPYVPRGPLHDWLVGATPLLAARGIALTEWQRDWDSAVWPHATAGFFKVKERIPRLLTELALA